MILPIGLVLQIGGYAVNLSAHYKPTPKSVSVSGYHRSDGTYIHPYHRRPSGAAQHDAPYEAAAQNKRMGGGFVSLIGGIVVAIVLVRFFATPDWDLLPDLKYTSHLPPKPRDFEVPSFTARARAFWVCCRCSQTITPGDAYYYAHVGRKYCLHCRNRLSDEWATELPKWLTYEAARRHEKAEKLKLRFEHYKRFYGRMPDAKARVSM
jgi:hypothetical protein